MVHNLGLFGMNSMIVAMGFAYGGAMQLIAGAMEWRRGNTFGTTAFLSYGAFWISFCFMNLLPEAGLFAAPDAVAKATYVFAWGIFTGLMFLGTLKSPIMVRVVFALLTVVFFMLAINDIVQIDVLGKITAVVGIALAMSALYTGIGEILNEVHGREFFPLGTKKS